MAVKDFSFKRMQDFRRLLTRAGVEGYFTADPLEMRYLSGLDLNEGEAVFLILPGRAYGITHQLIAAKLQGVAFLKTVIVESTLVGGALALAEKLRIKRVGFSPAKTDFLTGRQLAEANWVDAGKLLDEMRVVKYPDELSRIQKSCQIASAAFKEVKPLIKTGMSEFAVSSLMAQSMLKRGAESIPFNIVAFGANTADAHHTPSKTRKLKKNEAVLMDFGCLYEGYCSDMTRSWWHGDTPPAEYKQIWDLTLRAYRAGAKSLKAGLACREADASARRIIEEAGYGNNFFHSLGHGVGLEAHDSPLLGPRSIAVLEKNSPVTVEPGIYFSGKWGIRLEDTFLVTAAGSKKLTKN